MATTAFVGLPKRMLTATIDGREVQAPEGTTILDVALRRIDLALRAILRHAIPLEVA